MSQKDYMLLGKILCKGSGLRVFLEIPLTKKDSNGIKKAKKFRYEIGNLQQILAETNRQTSQVRVAGRKNPVGNSSGLRNTYGTIVFTQLDQGMIFSMFKDIRKYNSKIKQFKVADLDGFGLEDFTILEEDQELIGGPIENLTTDLFETDYIDLQDLPPVDIVVYGTADNITDGVYEPNKTYMFRCNKVTFLSETFGISAGSPMHDVATKVQILGSIEPWREVKIN